MMKSIHSGVCVLVDYLNPHYDLSRGNPHIVERGYKCMEMS